MKSFLSGDSLRASDVSVSCSGRKKILHLKPLLSHTCSPRTKPQSGSLQSVKSGTSATPGRVPCQQGLQQRLRAVSLDPISLGSFLLLPQGCHMTLHPPTLVSVQLHCEFSGPKMMPNKVLASKPEQAWSEDRASGCFSSTTAWQIIQDLVMLIYNARHSVSDRGHDGHWQLSMNAWSQGDVMYLFVKFFHSLNFRYSPKG